MVTRRHPTLVRYAAPAAFLAAVTVAVLVVRSGLSEGNDGGRTQTTATAPTEPGGGGATRPGTTTSGPPRFYRIRPGDTLETVAARFDTTVEQLLVLNPDVDPVALGIGERIRVK